MAEVCPETEPKPGSCFRGPFHGGQHALNALELGFMNFIHVLWSTSPIVTVSSRRNVEDGQTSFLVKYGRAILCCALTLVLFAPRMPARLWLERLLSHDNLQIGHAYSAVCLWELWMCLPPYHDYFHSDYHLLPLLLLLLVQLLLLLLLLLLARCLCGEQTAGHNCFRPQS